MIGYNRLKAGQSAGLRTHILVGIGSTLISLVQVSITRDTLDWVVANPDLSHVITADTTRLISQVVSGIGFLGAGAIIVTNNVTISGLTTAASLWTVAGIGIANGMGFWKIGIIGSLSVLFALIILSKFKKNQIYILDIHFDKPRTEMKDLFKTFDYYNLKVEDISFTVNEDHYHYHFRLIGERGEINAAQTTQMMLENVTNVVSINFH